MTRFACWILTGLLLGIFGLVTAYLLRERRLVGHDLPAFSVYSEAADGKDIEIRVRDRYLELHHLSHMRKPLTFCH